MNIRDVPNITVFCNKHNKQVLRYRHIIVHKHYKNQGDRICNSTDFEVRDIRKVDRDAAARTLIIVELADQLAGMHPAEKGAKLIIQGDDDGTGTAGRNPGDPQVQGHKGVGSSEADTSA